MSKKIFFFLLFLISNQLYSQIENITEKFILPATLEENSGLIFYNNKLITHNDSGNDANLYELDTITNQITRTISISNAVNNDWEDITQDNNYIYIGDFGNNLGNRTDLKIYKISKADYIANNTVTASIINFHYENQTDFNDNSQTNFDAEALFVLGNNIHIFTKNFGDFKTKQYLIPNTPGNYAATLLATYDVQGLITGASFNPAYNKVFLTGYTNQLKPFITILSDMNANLSFNNDLKFDLFPNIGYNQVEGIALVSDNHFLISSEKFTYNNYNFNQKLFAFDYNANVNSITHNLKSNFKLLPNPVKRKLFFYNLPLNSKVAIYNENGLLIFSKKINSTDFIWQPNFDLNKGIYFVKTISSNFTITKKIILLPN